MLCYIDLFVVSNFYVWHYKAYFVLSVNMHDVHLQEKCIIPKTKSHDESVQNKHMFSKFLYYR